MDVLQRFPLTKADVHDVVSQKNMWFEHLVVLVDLDRMP